MNKEITDNIINIQNIEELNWEVFSILPDNAMLRHRVELFEEWDFKKNDELGFDIYKVTYANNKKVWWICRKCKSSFDQKICRRTMQRSNCSYCSGHRINETNSLATMRPDIAKEWHPTKNGDLTPHDVGIGKNLRVWWICEHSHEWYVMVNDRTARKRGCPYCGHKATWIGFNDLWTTHPDIAKHLLTPEDGYKYSHKSGVVVDWKCVVCNTIVKRRRIADVTQLGIPCPICSDSTSYPEKVMTNLLIQLQIPHYKQKSFKWSRNRFYDFMIDGELSIIIETHGRQHYENHRRKRSRNLMEEQVNDRYKHVMALHNGIDNYIVIDCRNSELEWIKNNILNSELAMLFDLSSVNWQDIELKSRKSLHVEILELWNSGHTIKEIQEKTDKSIPAIERILKRFSNAGVCEYSK